MSLLITFWLPLEVELAPEIILALCVPPLIVEAAVHVELPRLRERFGITHATLQPEEPHTQPDAFRGCSLAAPDGRAACRLPSEMASHSHDRLPHERAKAATARRERCIGAAA